MLTITGHICEKEAQAIHALVLAGRAFNLQLQAVTRLGVYIDMQTTDQERRERTSFVAATDGSQEPVHSVVMGQPPAITLTIYKPVQIVDSPELP